MKLFVNRAATTSRSVLAFCQAEGINREIEDVDLMTGEHHAPDFSALNPNRLVPVLDDDGFVLTEAAAILRYLARKTDSGAYPADPKLRARVDELMSWFEANLYRSFGFDLVYPQLMPHHNRGDDELTRGAVTWGQKSSARWLKVLDEHFLKHGGPCLVGETPTIADYFAVSILSLGELIHTNFEAYPRLMTYYAGQMARPEWQATNEAFLGFAGSTAGGEFVGVA